MNKLVVKIVIEQIWEALHLDVEIVWMKLIASLFCLNKLMDSKKSKSKGKKSSNDRFYYKVS